MPSSPTKLDPVLKFLLDPETSSAAMSAIRTTSSGSNLSGRSVSFAGHALINKRCREIGVPEPDVSTIRRWQEQIARGELV